MKKTFANISMVCHVWAQHNQPYGTTGNGNVYFSGKAIYSYGDHFPIATFITNKAGTKVLFNTDSYSISTSNHQAEVRGAIRHLESDIIRTNTSTIKHIIQTYHYENPKTFKSSLIRHIEEHLNNVILRQAQNAAKRKKASLKDSDIQVANSAYESGLELLEFYGAKMPKTVFAKLETLRNNEKAIIEANSKEIDKRNKLLEKQRKQQALERAAKAQEAKEIWIKGETLPNHLYHALRDIQMVYMRVKDNEIETSRGAEFPIAHGKRAFTAIRNCKESNIAWERNGHTIHLGHFQIDSIDSNGNVKAGCHTIEWDEIERIARQLNIYP